MVSEDFSEEFELLDTFWLSKMYTFARTDIKIPSVFDISAFKNLLNYKVLKH